MRPKFVNTGNADILLSSDGRRVARHRTLLDDSVRQPRECQTFHDQYRHVSIQSVDP